MRKISLIIALLSLPVNVVVCFTIPDKPIAPPVLQNPYGICYFDTAIQILLNVRPLIENLITNESYYKKTHLIKPFITFAKEFFISGQLTGKIIPDIQNQYKKLIESFNPPDGGSTRLVILYFIKELSETAEANPGKNLYKRVFSKTLASKKEHLPVMCIYISNNKNEYTASNIQANENTTHEVHYHYVPYNPKTPAIHSQLTQNNIPFETKSKIQFKGVPSGILFVSRILYKNLQIKESTSITTKNKNFQILFPGTEKAEFEITGFMTATDKPKEAPKKGICHGFAYIKSQYIQSNPWILCDDNEFKNIWEKEAPPEVRTGQHVLIASYLPARKKIQRIPIQLFLGSKDFIENLLAHENLYKSTKFIHPFIELAKKIKNGTLQQTNLTKEDYKDIPQFITTTEALNMFFEELNNVADSNKNKNLYYIDSKKTIPSKSGEDINFYHITNNRKQTEELVLTVQKQKHHKEQIETNLQKKKNFGTILNPQEKKSKTFQPIGFAGSFITKKGNEKYRIYTQPLDTTKGQWILFTNTSSKNINNTPPSLISFLEDIHKTETFTLYSPCKQEKTLQTKPYGIKLVGASCHLNTALQMLLSCEKLIASLQVNKNFYTKEKSPIINELITFTENTTKDTSKLINALNILNENSPDYTLSKIGAELNIIKKENPDKNLYFTVDLKPNPEKPFNIASKLITNTKNYKERPTGYILCDETLNESKNLPGSFLRKDFGQEFGLEKIIPAKLKAIALYTGGHWYAYTNRNNKWYICDDSYIKELFSTKLKHPYKWLLYEIIETEERILALSQDLKALTLNI